MMIDNAYTNTHADENAKANQATLVYIRQDRQVKSEMGTEFTQ